MEKEFLDLIKKAHKLQCDMMDCGALETNVLITASSIIVRATSDKSQKYDSILSLIRKSSLAKFGNIGSHKVSTKLTITLINVHVD